MNLMRVNLGALIILVLVQLAGCSADLSNLGIGGNVGVDAKRLTTDTYAITTTGSTFTSASKIEETVRLKAAEVTLANGGTHFTMVRAAATAHSVAKHGPITPSEVATLDSIVKSEKTATEGTSNTDTQIKIFTVAEGKPGPPGALNAKEVISQAKGS